MKKKILKKKPLAKKAKKAAVKTRVKKKPVRAKKVTIRKIKKILKAKKVVKKTAKSVGKKNSNKPIGTVTHFYNEISVAIVRFKENVPLGALLHFRGATTDFKHPAKSMQYDHKPVAIAPKGKQIGIKVPKRVRPGDKVHHG